MNLSRNLRFYSSLSKLWVKFNGNQSIQVPTEDCVNIADFTEKVKQKLPNQLLNFDSNQITIHQSKEHAAFEPDELLKNISSFGSSAKTPLFVGTSTKTIYIQEVDEEYRPIESFTKVTVESDADVKDIIGKKGEALYKISNPNERITKFKQIEDGEKYNVYSRYLKSFSDEVRWQQMEDKAMEEVSLAMKNYLLKNLGSSVIEMPTDIMGSDGKIKQEWDGAFKVEDVLYLCEAKHVMTLDKVLKIPDRIKKFWELQPYAQFEFRNIKNVVGVACGTYIPELVRQEAHKAGLICVYPSGYRYRVDKEPPKDFEIVR
jgi:hypothetical protein